MGSEMPAKLASLYETDYQLWLNKTVEQLRSHDFYNIDLESLIEELESLGKSDKRAISSYLMRLCEHLQKEKHWYSEREMCWEHPECVKTFRWPAFHSDKRSAETASRSHSLLSIALLKVSNVGRSV